MAQRVMDCGDAGHILVSSSVADMLSQLSEWSPWLRDLGKCEVKHGVQVHIYNICKDNVGNAAVPSRLEKKKSRWRWYASLGVLVAGLALVVTVGPRFFARKTPPAAPAVQRTLTYYCSVLTPGTENWVRYSQEMVVPAHYQLRLYFSSPQAGHLYLLNEGPVPRNDMASFNILFPTTTTNGGSSALNANQELQFPAGRPILLDNDVGAEKVYMVWSSHDLPQLEALKKWTEAGHRGAVESREDVAAIHAFLRSHPMAASHVDEENSRTVLVQTGDPLVYMVKLAHQ
jgi:hypothetical protein